MTPDAERHTAHHTALPASPWVRRFAALIPAGAPVLDVACGRGRHLRLLAERGHPLVGLDRDADALAAARAALPAGAAAELIAADIENGPWPLPGRTFGGVVVTNYLWRALLPQIAASVAPGGALIYETFAAGNETVGKPSRPDFLLKPGELLELCPAADWRVVAYEDGFLSAPDRFVQRIAAVRRGAGGAASAGPERFPL